MFLFFLILHTRCFTRAFFFFFFWSSLYTYRVIVVVSWGFVREPTYTCRHNIMTRGESRPGTPRSQLAAASLSSYLFLFRSPCRRFSLFFSTSARRSSACEPSARPHCAIGHESDDTVSARNHSRASGYPRRPPGTVVDFATFGSRAPLFAKTKTPSTVKNSQKQKKKIVLCYKNDYETGSLKTYAPRKRFKSNVVYETLYASVGEPNVLMRNRIVVRSAPETTRSAGRGGDTFDGA